MAIFGVGFNFGANVPLVAFGLATAVTLLISMLRRPKPNASGSSNMTQMLTYELALFFAFFVVVTLVNEPAVSPDIQLGDPTF